MTENEVFEHISDLAGDYKCFDEKISHQESLILCNLIKEIQQYRAIGTVGGYENAIKAYTETYILMKEYKSKLQDFEAIGTIEEFKALKENTFFNFGSPLARIDEKSYNKAIDEFAEELLKVSEGNIDMYVWCSDIKRIAEQMKGEQL